MQACARSSLAAARDGVASVMLLFWALFSVMPASVAWAQVRRQCGAALDGNQSREAHLTPCIRPPSPKGGSMLRTRRWTARWRFLRLSAPQRVCRFVLRSSTPLPL